MAQIIQHHGCSEVSILASKSVFSFPWVQTHVGIHRSSSKSFPSDSWKIPSGKM